jgi:hypothetical protein
VGKVLPEQFAGPLNDTARTIRRYLRLAKRGSDEPADHPVGLYAGLVAGEHLEVTKGDAGALAGDHPNAFPGDFQTPFVSCLWEVLNPRPLQRPA